MSDELNAPPSPAAEAALTRLGIDAGPDPALLAPLLQTLAREVRAVNMGNGWGLDFNPEANDQEIPGYLALLHSEIVEAETAELPDHARHELGDLLVRALDLCELLDPGALGGRRWQNDHGYALDDLQPHDLRRFSWDDALFSLHRWVTAGLEIYRKEPLYLEQLLRTLVGLMREACQLILTVWPGTDIADLVREINAANSKREYRHGGLRT